MSNSLLGAEPVLVGTQVRPLPWDPLRLCPAPQRPHLARVQTRRFSAPSSPDLHLLPPMGASPSPLSTCLLFSLSRKHARGLGVVKVKGVIYELSCSS